MTISGVKIEGLLGMLTIKLNDRNFSKWVFQFKSALKGYKLFDHLYGSVVCPPKFIIGTIREETNDITQAFLEWETIDMALLNLLFATLSNEAIEHVLGCKTTHGAWSSLQGHYAFILKAKINTLRTEFQTI